MGIIELAIEAAATYCRIRAAEKLFNKRVVWLTATFCLVEGYEMLHHDEDYDLFQGHLV